MAESRMRIAVFQQGSSYQVRVRNFSGKDEKLLIEKLNLCPAEEALERMESYEDLREDDDLLALLGAVACVVVVQEVVRVGQAKVPHQPALARLKAEELVVADRGDALVGAGDHARGAVARGHAADARVAERLGIKVGDPVIVMRRLRTVNGQPFCIETTHMADARVPGLVADDLLGQKSFYDLLERRYGIRMHGGEGVVSLTTASPQEAELLELGRDTSAMLFQAVSLDVDDRPMEFLHSVNHPRMVVFTTS